MDRWMDKEDVYKEDTHTHTHIHNGILLSHKQWNLAACDNMDGPWEYYIKWNKSCREIQTPYDFIHMWSIKNKQISKINEQTKEK